MSIARSSTFALAIAIAAGTNAAAATTPQTAAVMSPIRQFVAGVNPGGNIASALAACAPHASVIDEFPPHHWNSCADWASANDALSKTAGDTDEVFTIGKPWHVDVTGNAAYAVIPATYAYKERGKPVSESGVWTVVLAKNTAAWRITAWSWGKH